MDKKETHTMPVSRSYIWEMNKERKDEIIKELLSLIQDTLVKEIPTCAEFQALSPIVGINTT